MGYNSSPFDHTCKTILTNSVIRIGLGSRGLVNLTRETAVCSLAVQTHSIHMYNICRFFHLTKEMLVLASRTGQEI